MSVQAVVSGREHLAATSAAAAAASYDCQVSAVKSV